MKKDLSLKELFVMGGALFSMHFGASCMLYPVQWGKDSGSSVLIAYIAVLLSALLLPLLAYVALARSEGTYLSITRHIAPKFGPAFCSVTVLVMGPLYVIPRMSAASWDALAQLTGGKIDSPLAVILFNILFYALSYWFVSSRSDTADKVGKLLFPVLIVIVIGVIGKGLLTPITTEWLPKSYPESPLVYGFLNGYQTGDLPAALMFGLVIIQGIRKAGVPRERTSRNLLVLGFVGLGMLAVTHLGHMVVGAGVGNTTDLTLSALYSEVVFRLWGTVGAAFFNVALVFAALTTAVGLAGSTAEFFEESLGGKVSYRTVCLTVCIVCTVISSFGLSNIVTYVGPLLDACYPASIIVVLFYVFCPKNRFGDPRFVNAARFSLIGTAVMGLIDACSTYNTLLGIGSEGFSRFYAAIPLSSVRLSWIPVSLVLFLIGFLTARHKA